MNRISQPLHFNGIHLTEFALVTSYKENLYTVEAAKCDHFGTEPRQANNTNN
jgi:hypothetical protein